MMDNNFIIDYRHKYRNKKNRLAVFLAVLFIGVIVMLSLLNQFDRKESTDEFLADQKTRVKNNSLKEAVENALAGTKGTYGVVIKNLKTGENYSANQNMVFDAGSLYKLWVMAAAFKKIEEGAWKEDQILTEDIAVLNTKFYIDSDAAEQTEGTATFTVTNALEQVIAISHNYAALLLAEKLKLSFIKSFLRENDFNQSTVGTDGANPTVTPRDTALFFEKLYKGELASKEFTGKMLTLLKKQQLNDKLPKYLPEGTHVAHKTGEIGWFSHDAGIVYSPRGDYIIAVLSKSNFPLGAEDRIAGVSKAVYDYFEKKNR